MRVELAELRSRPTKRAPLFPFFGTSNYARRVNDNMELRTACLWCNGKRSAQATIELLTATVALLLAIIGCGIAISMWRVIPVWDQWAAVAFYKRYLEGAISWQDLFLRYNEHRATLEFISFVLNFELFRGDGFVPHALVLISHLILGATIGLIIGWGGPVLTSIVAVLIRVCVSCGSAANR